MRLDSVALLYCHYLKNICVKHVQNQLNQNVLGPIVNGVRQDSLRHIHESFRLGICLWDDIIEYGGQQSWKYSEFYLPALARGIQDSQPEVSLILLFCNQ